MNDRAYANAQAQQKTLIGSSPKRSLLQRTCVYGGSTGINGLYTECRDKRLTLLSSRGEFAARSVSIAAHGNPSAQENVTSLSTVFDKASHFGHDFSRIPVYSSRLPVIQTKLQINQPGNVYEQEADHVSEQVMSMNDPEPPISDDEDQAKNSLMRKQSAELGANAATGSLDVPPIVHAVLRSGGGQPLDTTTRAFMEPRLGYDFSRIRVHTDVRAAESARAVNALAYTLGRDVVFGKGQYTPGTSEGRRLLAHELTHVAQQQLSRASTSGASIVYPQQAEWEAERNAQAADGGGSLTTTCYLPALMRTPQPQERQQKEAACPSKETDALALKEAQEYIVEFKTPGAKFSMLNGNPIAVLPATEGEVTTPGADSETGTKFHIHSERDCIQDQVEGKVTTIPVSIYTHYKPKIDLDRPSGYGIGTRPEDVGEQKKLRYHEQSHVADSLAYIQAHPMPRFEGKRGMEVKDFHAAYLTFTEKILQYRDEHLKFTTEKTDCAKGSKTIDKFRQEKGMKIASVCGKPEEKKTPVK